jgi:hypothetical protein
MNGGLIKMANMADKRSPVSISQRQMRRFLSTLAEPPPPAAPSHEKSLPRFSFGLGGRFILFCCLATVIIEVAYICSQTNIFKHLKKFDINQVIIQPGLFIQCKDCGKNIFNVSNVEEACGYMCTRDFGCPSCHSTGTLQISVKCPECGLCFNPVVRIDRRVIKQSDDSGERINCSINATCPTCGHRYLDKRDIVLCED